MIKSQRPLGALVKREASDLLDEILGEIIGQRTLFARFGRSGNGASIRIGKFDLIIDCPWRLLFDHAPTPGFSGEDGCLDELNRALALQTLVAAEVSQAAADLEIEFSRGYRLQAFNLGVFPESWKLIDRSIGIGVAAFGDGTVRRS